MDTRPIMQRFRSKSPASAITAKKIKQRIDRICAAISANFTKVSHANQIQLKHLLYIRDCWYAECGFSQATIADYQRAMRLLVSALDRDGDWLIPLKLAKDRSKGGRPTSINVTRTRVKARRGVL